MIFYKNRSDLDKYRENLENFYQVFLKHKIYSPREYLVKIVK
jgi:hypothetical protein